MKHVIEDTTLTAIANAARSIQPVELQQDGTTYAKPTSPILVSNLATFITNTPASNIAVVKINSSRLTLKKIKWDDYMTDPKKQLIAWFGYGGSNGQYWDFNIPELDIWNMDNEAALNTLYPNQGAMNYYNSTSESYMLDPAKTMRVRSGKKDKILFLDTGYMNYYIWDDSAWEEVGMALDLAVFIYKP